MITKATIKNFSREYSDWRRQTIKMLERKRNRILRSKPDERLRDQLLTPIESQLGRLQQEVTDIAALKAGVKWRENSEKSTGFLKRIHKKRTIEQGIQSVRSLDDGSHSTDPVTMRENTHKFYQHLYDTDPIDEVEVDQFLNQINVNRHLSPEDNYLLIEKITIEDIQDQARRSPKQSSPGSDGLGYPFLRMLFSMPCLHPLLLIIYNEALIEQKVPSSWKDIRRHISLINCDAKIFTRIINSRMNIVVGGLIDRTQTGFMKSRFIGDNGLILNLILQQAK